MAIPDFFARVILRSLSPDTTIPAKRTGERWSKFTREEIEKHEDSLDLGLIRDDSIKDHNELPDPIKSGEEAIVKLREAIDLLQSVVKELKSNEDVK